MRDSQAPSDRYLSFTAIAVPQVAVDQAIQTVLARIAPGRFRRGADNFDIERIYSVDPPPGGAHLFKMAIYTPQQLPTGCVLVTNLVDGWNSLCHLLAQEHGQFQFQAISTRENVEYPSNRIEVWNFGKSLRKVIAMRDSDQWEFLQRGELQYFEEADLYRNRIIRRRLDRGAIIRYSKRMGWGISEPSFWESSIEAIYFTETAKRSVS